MKKRPTANLLCACTLIVALIMPAFAGETTQTPEIFQPYYKILNLNTFHWDPLCLQDCTSEAFDVSVWGRVVGQSTVWGGAPTYQSQTLGFRTAPNAAIGPWSGLALPPGADRSEAFGINEFGAAVGESGGAVLWPLAPPFQVTSLGYTSSFATAINDLGVAVGNRILSQVMAAWIGSPVYVLSADYQSSASAINNDGFVVGHRDVNPDPAGVRFRAFRWDGGPSLQNLGTLNPDCTTCESYARGINDYGAIVGSSEFTAQLPYHTRATIWPATVLGPPLAVDLGTLCSGRFAISCESYARDINIHGHIVGVSSTGPVSLPGDGDQHAFLSKGTGMTDLNTLLAPADQANWVLWKAEAINDLGQIAGTGYFQGTKIRAYLLTPPLQVIFATVKSLHVLFSADLAAERRSLDTRMNAAKAALECSDLEEAHLQLDLYENEVQALVLIRRLNLIRATKLMAGAALIRRQMEDR